MHYYEKKIEGVHHISRNWKEKNEDVTILYSCLFWYEGDIHAFHFFSSAGFKKLFKFRI